MSTESTKKGRKCKNIEPETEAVTIHPEIDKLEEAPIVKKRGRKPKGGKIVNNLIPLNSVVEPKTNIILHLRCSVKDLENDVFKTSNIEGFNFPNNKNDLTYDNILDNIQKEIDIFEEVNKIPVSEPCQNTDSSDRCDIKEVWQKLKVLENDLHLNNINITKSACFWCTYVFDNPVIYIPKHYSNNSYNVYGCFCSPECATAFLMEENIDSSAKFERYQLLNHVYSKIYEYKKNIKPAPNPYYMLDKYYGNLTIQEYRSLLKNDRLFLIVDKPLTRILPELHEDNDDFVINNKIIPSNKNSIKSKICKKNKNTVFSDNFGLSK